MPNNKSLALVVVPGLLLFAISCGKSSDKKNDPGISGTVSGVETTSASTINITGSLNLGAIGLTAGETKGVLAFTLVGGRAQAAAREVEVAADGSFTVPVDRSSGSAATLKAQLAAEPIVRDASFIAGLSSFFGETEDRVQEYIAEMSDAQLRAELTSEIDAQVAAGSVTLLVAYDKSPTGDKVSEANSFKFIGLPTASGKSLAAIDSQSIKGNLGLGSIALGASDDAKSSLAATDALNVSAEAAETMADMSAALKSIKNSWMNTAWNARPFFMWNGGQTLNSVLGSFSAPANTSYRGYGFYVGSQSATPFAFDDICGSGAKEVKFAPPSAVDVATGMDQNGLPSDYQATTAFHRRDRAEYAGWQTCLRRRLLLRPGGWNK